MRVYAYIIALALLACSRSAQVSDPGGQSAGSGAAADDGDGDVDGAEAGDDDGTEGGDDGVVYPGFRFTGTGAISCDGSNEVGTGNDVGSVTAGLATEVDAAKMILNSERANMVCSTAGSVDSKCDNASVSAKAQNSTGINTYVRLSQEELTKAEKDDSFVGGKFAVFAKSITAAPKVGSPSTYNFDKPLPVFPFPSPASRFKPIEDGATWTAHSTGTDAVDVTVTMSLIAGNDNVIIVESNVNISGDSDRSHYANFPIPRRSIYKIDAKKRRVTEIEVTKWFRGDDCPNAEAFMTFKLCQVTTNGEVEDIIPCQ